MHNTRETPRLSREREQSRLTTTPESVRLTVADQKRNEHTGVAPSPPSPFEIAQSGCVFTPRGNAREKEKENEKQKEGGREGKRGRDTEKEREGSWVA